VNSLLKSALIAAIAVGVVGCGHEARVTGPTQCLAPHAPRFARASEISQDRVDLAQRTAAGTTPL